MTSRWKAGSMAEADKDGRAAQIVGDLMATTVMAINDGMGEGRKRLQLVNELASVEAQLNKARRAFAPIFLLGMLTGGLFLFLLDVLVGAYR